MIQKYVKKPVVVEALHFTDWSKMDELLNFCGTDNVLIVLHQDGSNDLYIKTLEGNMKVEDGDYIIKGVKGEFYPCKPDIFEMTYERIHDNKQDIKDNWIAFRYE